MSGTLTIASSKPANVRLSHTIRKEAQRGRVPDLKSHSKHTGHQDLNVGPGSGLRAPSSEDIPPLSSGPNTVTLPSVGREGLAPRIQQPEERGSWSRLLSPSAWLALLASGRLAPSPHGLDLCPRTTSVPSLCLLLGGLRTAAGRRYKKLLGSLHPTARSR